MFEQSANLIGQRLLSVAQTYCKNPTKPCIVAIYIKSCLTIHHIEELLLSNFEANSYKESTSKKILWNEN